MAESRRVRPWILGSLILVGGVGAFQIAARYVEREAALRIAAYASRLGARVTFDQLRVGLLPPFSLTGVVIEGPGQGLARIDSISVSPRFWGARGLSLIGRVRIEGARATLPAGLEVALRPSVWDVDPGRSLTLRWPIEGLVLTSEAGPKGRVFDLRATKLQMDQLVGFRLEGVSNGELGTLDAEAHFEGDPRIDGQGRWRLDGLGVKTEGTMLVTPTQSDARLDFEARIEQLDFASVLRAMGQGDDARDPLGSLSGAIRASGLLSDPATLEVKQELLFTRPVNRPVAVTSLRGDFSHGVTTNLGARKRIEVSPGAPDFIALADVPPLFIRALLIAEDAAFFSHPGIDLAEIPKAVATNWARGEAVRGASTITQQLAKNLFLTREKSLHRKLKELSYSFLLESTVGKLRILEIYLNIIEWGPGLYGLRPAAEHYFGKEPSELTPKEIAFLVSLIPGPIKYQRSIQGDELGPGFDTLVNNLLVKLRSVDALTEEEYDAAREEKLLFRWAKAEGDLVPESMTAVHDPHAAHEPSTPTPDRAGQSKDGNDNQYDLPSTRHRVGPPG
ncbi:MAG: transglycosylase domain-containing protein [Vicinamibacteria bacterium]|nr:transglycosylase domain-containing protein [Vicinamibacteria bacterium]